MSAPTTKAGRKLEDRGKPRSVARKTQEVKFVAAAPPADEQRSATTRSKPIGKKLPDQRQKSKEDVRSSLIEAFKLSHDGFSADRVVTDPELDAAFLGQCRRLGVQGTDKEINSLLFRLRKSGRLSAAVPTTRRTENNWIQTDRFIDASEIALRRLMDLGHVSLDDILCCPEAAQQFDRIAEGLAPGFRPFDYRWAAMTLRKEAKEARTRSSGIDAPQLRGKYVSEDRFSPEAVPQSPGLYVVYRSDKSPLYVGETLNLFDRLARNVRMSEGRSGWHKFADNVLIRWTEDPHECGASRQAPVSSIQKHLFARQSKLISKLQPSLNFNALAD